MKNICTMVVYHYVRDLPKTRFPEVKGLLLSKFIDQLDYLQKHYVFVTMQDCIHAIYHDAELPPNAVLLTFDDGYLDHFTNVFPILYDRGIQGCFFPTAKATTEDIVLDVNKIHFTLASVSDVRTLIEDVYALMDEYRNEFNLKSNEYYFNKLGIRDRFDVKEVTFIKQLLQVELDPALRANMVDRLFKRYVTTDEASFSHELYLKMHQIKCMQSSGMFLGGHSYDHVWLNRIPSEQKEREISLTVDFIKQLGIPKEEWVMNYPYGQYDDEVISIVKDKQFVLGLAGHLEIAQLTRENAFTLERLDTNDFPKESNANPNEWTQRILDLELNEAKC